jgi:hypothetical protein
MNYINGLSIESIINNLYAVEVLINAHRNNIPSIRNLFDAVASDQKIMERIDNVLSNVTTHINQLKTIRKNTLYFPTFVDCHALVSSLNNFGNPIDSAEIVPIWCDDNAYNTDWNDIPPIKTLLKIHYSRYAMDGNGFHVGYENVVFTAECIKKSEMKLSGIPYNLSSYVVNPDSFEIESKDLPPEEFPVNESHDESCPYHSNTEHDFESDPFPDDCTCGLNDCWEGYYPPDDDFFYTEINQIIHSILQSNLLPSAEYDANTREWSIKDEVNWHVGEGPSDK